MTAFLRDETGSHDLGVPTHTWDDHERPLSSVAGGHDLLVAGPLSDAAAAAVESDVAPALGISWAFDLLLEAQVEEVADRVRRTLPRLAGVHVDCRSLADRARGLGVAPERISVAAWGIDTDYFSAGSQPRAHAAGKVVFSARAWEPMYDVPTVLRGFALAHRQDRSLRLVLGGEGSERARIEALIGELGIVDAVARVGRLSGSQVRDWLRRSDVYVTASHSDGSSLSLLEALSVGLPVVVSDLDGNREWVGSETVGRLFPVGDAEMLAHALLEEVRKPECTARRAARRDVVLGKGDWARNRLVFLGAVERALRAG